MSTAPSSEPPTTPSEASISWRVSDRDDDSAVIEIEEETDDIEQLDTTPMKRMWNNSASRHADVAPNKNVEEIKNNENGNVNNVNNIGSKPKMTNMSLLSSTVALATMERCLLGNLATMREEMGEPTTSDDNANDAAAAAGFVDYSKQCKPGHVIDLLELRRLSSRGVPDEPHEVRTPTSPQRKTIGTNNMPNNNHHIAQTQTFGGINPHRSYRPLVWRVLLGYLPPQTDQWNEVLARDRKLYANLVNELFESTCPSPHERYNEKELKQKREEEDNHSEATPTNDDEPPSPPPLSDTPVTPNTKKRIMPGMLSARMQQEWVRDGEESDSKGRISPMCAMNTPKIRSRKTAQPLPVNLEVESPSTEVGENGKDDDQLNEKMKQSLLLPDDDDAEAGKFTIDDDEEGDGEDAATKDTAETSDTEDQQAIIDKNKITRSVSITKTSEEGVEAHIPLTPHEEADKDEEEDLHLLDEIRKDVIRTHPDLRFFLEPEEDLGQKRYAALERILYVWAKLNKGVRYVQGMNEIVGTLYFVLAHDADTEWAEQAEADTYFLFNSILVEMRDVFVPDLDEADTGIHGRISNMINLLSLHDPEVRCHLDGVGIDPSFYSVRWLTTLLSREFLLPDTIRLWDSMFSSTHKDNFLRYVGVTMVMVIRDQLLEGDFSACLRLLQAYPPCNLDRLLESSRALWIYESQITLACHKGGISLGHALRSITPPPSIVMAYGLHGGVAPQIGEQVREAGQRGLAVARDGASAASSTVANAGKSFFGNAMNFWRSGSSQQTEEKRGGDLRRSKTAL
mmetsp:Transcript_9924/g.15330  ORF Transcript_9924/g.15330 Transcript_9924/m.15330 type:complete len:796 (+) Transcript_9924:219-2606(+)